ncbi:hypothetical protein RF11_09942 [Thelohanellus kitauei]|uniref:Integrase zinc-binding domain-containing protein n=1 Tax=Thelohanellus kitauei TaxID=669202 RepID=A0A0C2MI31_THEKT|nr:hypothetical protein RF11_09942 [Thelohanellus kitauei]
MKNLTGKRGRWLLEFEEYDYEVEYVSGKENLVADALSRLVCATMLQNESSFMQEKQCDADTSRLLDIVKQRTVSGETNTHKEKGGSNYVIVNDILCKKGRRGSVPVIPSSSREKIFHSCHINSLCHPGLNKTLEALRSRCYWKGMSSDVARWISKC